MKRSAIVPAIAMAMAFIGQQTAPALAARRLRRGLLAILAVVIAHSILNPAYATTCVPAHVSADAERYYEMNKNRADRRYGKNWFRVMVAFGDRSASDWPRTGDAPPYTAAEARTSQGVWHGWKPFADALQCLEDGEDFPISVRNTACDLAAAIAEAKASYQYQFDNNLARVGLWWRVLRRLGATAGLTAPNSFNQAPVTSAELEAVRSSTGYSGWDVIITAVKCIEAEEASPTSVLEGKIENFAERYSLRKSNNMMGLGGCDRWYRVLNRLRKDEGAVHWCYYSSGNSRAQVTGYISDREIANWKKGLSPNEKETLTEAQDVLEDSPWPTVPSNVKIYPAPTASTGYFGWDLPLPPADSDMPQVCKAKIEKVRKEIRDSNWHIDTMRKYSLELHYGRTEYWIKSTERCAEMSRGGNCQGFTFKQPYVAPRNLVRQISDTSHRYHGPGAEEPGTWGWSSLPPARPSIRSLSHITGGDSDLWRGLHSRSYYHVSMVGGIPCSGEGSQVAANSRYRIGPGNPKGRSQFIVHRTTGALKQDGTPHTIPRWQFMSGGTDMEEPDNWQWWEDPNYVAPGSRTSCDLAAAIAEAKASYQYQFDNNLARVGLWWRVLLRLGATAGLTAPNSFDQAPVTSAELEAVRSSTGYSGWDVIITAVKCLEAENAPKPQGTVTIHDATVAEGRSAMFRMDYDFPNATNPTRRVCVTGLIEQVGGTATGDDYTLRDRYWREGINARICGTGTYWGGIQGTTDGHDDGGETAEFTFTVTGVTAWSGGSGRPHGMNVVVTNGTVTITNDGALPKEWLARFGRTAAEQAVEGIAGRVAAPRTAGVRGTIAGQALNFDPRSGSGTGPGSQSPEARSGVARAFGASAGGPGAVAIGGDVHGPEWGPGRAFGFGAREPQPRSYTMTAREALLGSSFTATGETDGSGGSLAVWGRAAQSSFDGGGGTFSLDGEVTTAMLGADYARGGWLVGMALLQSDGEGDFAGSGGDYELEASLTSAVPYAALQASERLRLWGAAGHGTGEVTLKPEPGGSMQSDIAWTMAAAGLRGDVIAPPKEGSGPALAVISDAFRARTSSDRTRDLVATDADVTRLRLGLEASYRMTLDGGGSVTPKLEVGARHDGGDAETGFGVELGGGLAWMDPRIGLSLDLSGRTLIAHGSDDLDDRGFAASLAWDPDPATQRGPSLTLTQDWGGQARGGLDALFRNDPLSDRTGSGEPTARWQAEAAWGFPVFSGRFTGSPHVGLGLATGARDYSLGWRLTPAANANAPDLSFGVKATRRESDTAAPEHVVGFEAVARW